MKILAINPGSTSTKIGVFEDDKLINETTIRHEASEVTCYEKIADQFDFRKDTILKFLREADFTPSDFAGFAGRGGLLKPIAGGTYAVNEAMLKDLREGYGGEHASNLGGLIADALAKETGGKAFIVDPVVVDELTDIARITGHPLMPKVSIFHALNQKAIAKQFAKEQGKKYEDMNLVVAHIGGGVSVGAHEHGRVIDVNDALQGDGPFSPERSGTLPTNALVNICFSGKYTIKEVKEMIKGKGGLVAFFGSNNVKALSEQAETDEKVKLVLEAMYYQIAKEIGSACVALKGRVDAILLTGGVCYGKDATDYIKDHVEFLAPVHVYPGEDELSALAAGVLRVLNGEEDAKIYS